ncbi:hypothetical protein HBB16_13140 [Pseudonocardia sp. MCCB 268]|nr:hypothetical protein [Pseudonocardia cytotoxica]
MRSTIRCTRSAAAAEHVGQHADEVMHVMLLVTDADGHVLWRDGAHVMLHPPTTSDTCEAPADRGRDRHQRDGHRARARRTGPQSTRLSTWSAPTTTGCDAVAPVYSGHAIRSAPSTSPVPVTAPGAGPVGDRDRAARREPAAGPPGDRRRAVAGEEHAAPGHAARRRGALLSATGRNIASEPYGLSPGTRPAEEWRRPGATRGRAEMAVEPLAEGYLLVPLSRSPGTRSSPVRRSRVALHRRCWPADRERTETAATLRPAEVLTMLRRCTRRVFPAISSR